MDTMIEKGVRDGGCVPSMTRLLRSEYLHIFLYFNCDVERLSGLCRERLCARLPLIRCARRQADFRHNAGLGVRAGSAAHAAGCGRGRQKTAACAHTAALMRHYF